MHPAPALRLRPTSAQAVARGVHAGVAVGGAGSAVVVIAGWLVTGGLGPLGWVAILTPLLCGGLVGAGLGFAFGRAEGTDIDHAGIRSVPAAVHVHAPWRHIAASCRRRRQVLRRFDPRCAGPLSRAFTLAYS